MIAQPTAFPWLRFQGQALDNYASWNLSVWGARYSTSRPVCSGISPRARSTSRCWSRPSHKLVQKLLHQQVKDLSMWWNQGTPGSSPWILYSAAKMWTPGHDVPKPPASFISALANLYQTDVVHLQMSPIMYSTYSVSWGSPIRPGRVTNRRGRAAEAPIIEENHLPTMQQGWEGSKVVLCMCEGEQTGRGRKGPCF